MMFISLVNGVPILFHYPRFIDGPLQRAVAAALGNGQGLVGVQHRRCRRRAPQLFNQLLFFGDIAVGNALQVVTRSILS